MRRGGLDFAGRFNRNGRNRQHSDILEQPVPRGRRRKRHGLFAWPLKGGLRIAEDLRGVLSLHARPAEIPAALDIECHLHVQPRALAQGMAVKLTPGLTAEKRPPGHLPIAILIRAARIDDQGTSEPFLLHRLQVTCDGLGRHVAIEPPPVGVEPRLRRRIDKAAFKSDIVGN